MPNTTPPNTLADYWQEQIEAWQSSGQSQQGFCQTHDLSYLRFCYWRGRLRKQASQQKSTPSSGFVPVTHLIGDGLTLVLPNGLQLRGIASDNLPVVQQLLAHLS
ncbi:MAG: hypothetical protein AB2813_07770 [Candidatus Sedimenticola endophacoides]